MIYLHNSCTVDDNNTLSVIGSVFMHKTIRVKLFLTFLMTTLLVVSGMYVFMRWSLDRGFTEFVETRQQERVTRLIEGLTEYYANNQNWSNLVGDKQKWIDLLWQSIVITSRLHGLNKHIQK